MHQDSCLKLFGVQISGGKDGGEVEEDVMRKSRSMGNLADAHPAGDGAGNNGYLSDGGLVPSGRRRSGPERKKGVPWTEEEHRTFLAGLEKLGKGDWRGISRNFVTTRTPTQVASHAQKYFLRQNNQNKKKRRSSLFDVVIRDLSTAPETSPRSLKKPHGAAEADSLPQGRHLVEKPAPISKRVGFSGILRGRAVPALPISIPEPPKFHANSTAFAADFLKLSFDSPKSYPLSATQSIATFPSKEIGDLELSIAPPQPNNLGKLSSQGAGGAISVV